MKRGIQFIVLVVLSGLLAAEFHAEPGVGQLTGTTIADMQVLRWTEKAPGVWATVVGRPESMTYTTFAGSPPQSKALAGMPTPRFPWAEQTCRGQLAAGRAVVRLPLSTGEEIYGLGLQFQGMNRRGNVFHLRVDHYSRGTDRTHAPVPLYLSSEGYGVLFNSPRVVSIYAGVGNRQDSPALPVIRDRNTDRAWEARPRSDAVEASVVSEGMEVLVFGGPTPLDALRRYNLFSGGGVLPPKWGLGFWHRMRTNATDRDVEDEAAEFRKRDFPLDVIGLEPGWQSRSYPCTFEWNSRNFPQPAAFLKRMAEAGIMINLWENPYISPEAGIYERIKPFTGSHMVWLGLVPDFTLEGARSILAEQHRKAHIDPGVSGYKIDEVDGYDYWLWPDHAVFPSGTGAVEMRQTYALQLQRLIGGLFRERNRRTFGLVRASNAAASAHPFVIYSDHYDHREFVTALVNSGFAGVLWAPEIRSAKSSEEWVRRMQSVGFSHLMQLNGWADNTKPWSFPAVEKESREAIQLRLRLLPYIYTAYARYHYEGTPPIRAMVLEPESDTMPLPGSISSQMAPFARIMRPDVTDQFMFGDCLLVAPIFAGQESRTVILPQGQWYDFYTGEPAGGGKTVTVKLPLDRIPLFVKEGGIVPMIEPVQQISKMRAPVKLAVRHYGRVGSAAMLYDDDGESFDYEKGRYCWLELKAIRGTDGQWRGSARKTGGDWSPIYDPIAWEFMTR